MNRRLNGRARSGSRHCCTMLISLRSKGCHVRRRAGGWDDRWTLQIGAVMMRSRRLAASAMNVGRDVCAVGETHKLCVERADFNRIKGHISAQQLSIVVQKTRLGSGYAPCSGVDDISSSISRETSTIDSGSRPFSNNAYLNAWLRLTNSPPKMPFCSRTTQLP